MGLWVAECIGNPPYKSVPHQGSHPHPEQKHSVLCTWTHRAKGIANQERLKEELRLLGQIFHQICYREKEIPGALKGNGKRKSDREKENKGVAVIHFCKTVSSQIGLLLTRANIRTVFCVPPPSLKTGQQMHLVKNRLELGVPGAYHIPCSCGQSYIGQTGCNITVCCKEHQHYLRLEQAEQTALAEHDWRTGHKIMFSKTETFSVLLVG